MSKPTLSAPAHTVNYKRKSQLLTGVGDGAAPVLSSVSPVSSEPVGASVGAAPSGSIAQRLEQGTHNQLLQKGLVENPRATADITGAHGACASDVRDAGWRGLAHLPDTLEFTYKAASVVYFLLGRTEKVLYVGSTTDLAARLRSHRKDKSFTSVRYVEVVGGHEKLEHVESVFISIYRPRFNRTKLGSYGICWFPQSTIDYVVKQFYGGEYSRIKSRELILQSRPAGSTDFRFHLARINCHRSRVFMEAVYGITVVKGKGGKLRWKDAHGTYAAHDDDPSPSPSRAPSPSPAVPATAFPPGTDGRGAG